MKRHLLLIAFLGCCLALSAQGQYDVDSTFRNSVYWKRMKTLGSGVTPYYDEQVLAEIKAMLKDPRTPAAIGRYEFYRDSIAHIFQQLKLPAELQLVAFANTFFEEGHVSPSGETGMWPLPYYVGKKYGLNISSYVDQRRNLFSSTYAAAHSLADLYHIYNDWYFTIAAFRCGPVEMNKAIRLASNSLDYFTVEPYIDYSYRKAFSRFMASLYVVHYYKEHGLEKKPWFLPVLDTACTPRTLNFQELASGSKTPIALFSRLNYQYKKKVVPNSPYHHCFVLPKSHVKSFHAYLKKLDHLDEQKRIKDSMERVAKLIEKFNPDSTGYQVLVMEGRLTVLDSAGKKVDPDIPIKTDQKTQTNPGGNRWVFYTVKRGDALILLADCFEASVRDVKRWNRIRGNTIRKGQRMKFLVPANRYKKYSSINRMSASQKQRLRRRD